MKTYDKIDTIFERDTEGTKKLIEGKYRDITVERTHVFIGTDIKFHLEAEQKTLRFRSIC